MPPSVATLVFITGILGLFLLDRDRSARTSPALWIPTAWLLINGSRPVSVWLQSGPKIENPDQYLDGSPLDATVFGILLLAALVVLGCRGGRVGKVLRANAPIILFFLYCGVSTLWSDYSFVSFKRWVKATGDVAMILVVLTDSDRHAAIKRLLSRISFLLVPVSVLFVKYYPDLGRSYNKWTWATTYTGVTTFKNLLGMTCLICGLGSLWRFLIACQAQRKQDRLPKLIAHGTILAMVVRLFWMANSMTSLACFVLAGSVLTAVSLFKIARKPAMVHLLGGSVIALSLFALFSGMGGGLVESVGRDATLTGRTGIWQVVISLSANPLLGAGFESYWLGDRLLQIWDRTMRGLQEAHNGYLEVYLNLGWLGISLLAVVIAKGYGNILRALREDREAGKLNLAFFIAGLIFCNTEAGFRMMAPVWVAFLLATTAVPGPVRVRARTEKATEESLAESVRHRGLRRQDQQLLKRRA